MLLRLLVRTNRNSCAGALLVGAQRITGMLLFIGCASLKTYHALAAPSNFALAQVRCADPASDLPSGGATLGTAATHGRHFITGQACIILLRITRQWR